MTGTREDPARLAATVIRQVMTDLESGSHRGVVVDSPPGAGKSTLVVHAAGRLAAAGEPLIVIAQTNEQVDDLVDRLATAVPGLPIGRLSRQDYTPTERINRHGQVAVGAKVTDLTGRPVLVGTAAKWATVTEGNWPWAIIDEAYQMRSDMLLRVANRFRRALFVGDPGQLDPFSTVELDRWVGLSWDPMQSAVSVLLRHNPELPLHRLPVSWRLPASAAPVVAQAFYPFTGFRAGTGPGDRRLEFGTAPSRGGGTAPSRGGGAAPWRGGVAATEPLDETLETAAATGWALHELPARHAVRTDAEATGACAALALRLLRRGGVAVSEREPGGAPVSADRIAIGAAHRDQVAAILDRLGPEGRGITVDTANRLQGREYDVTVVLHPLSGRRDATAFHLESGRLCVLASRHRHACIVVARAGIAELLDAHPSTEPVHLDVPVRFPDGWEAHHSVLAHLAAHRIRAA